MNDRTLAYRERHAAILAESTDWDDYDRRLEPLLAEMRETGIEAQYKAALAALPERLQVAAEQTDLANVLASAGIDDWIERRWELISEMS